VVSSAPAGTTLRIYRAFGLRILADLALPELAPVEGADDPVFDVEIRRSAVGTPCDSARSMDPSLHVAKTDVWLETSAGRFRASRGRAIHYEPAPGASAGDVRLFLLGTMLGAILHQRGVLPLHANAIQLGDHAIALAGPSGAGKSTLAAYFMRQGRTVFSDDVCAVSFDGNGQASVMPGLARIKLWGETLAALGQSRDGLDRVAEGFDKFSLPMTRAAVAPAPLRRLYVLELEAGASIRVERLTGATAVNAVLSNIYRWPVAAAMGMTADHFANAIALARVCDFWSLRRPRDLSLLPELAKRVSTENFEDLP